MVEYPDINIGIVEADKLKENPSFLNEDHYWWGRSWGYSYYQHASVWHNRMDESYGKQLEKGDIVGVCLDLKENYDLSYSVNGTEYGKAFNVAKDKTYKFAIGFYQGKVTLLSFEIN